MTSGRMRAGVVIGVIALCSAVAGAAVERVVPGVVHRRFGGPWRGSAEQDARRRKEMLNRMTKDLQLSNVQRAAIDSVMQHSDSSLHIIRAEMEPRLERVLQRSRAEIESRLTPTQKTKFEQSILARRRPYWRASNQWP